MDRPRPPATEAVDAPRAELFEPGTEMMSIQATGAIQIDNLRLMTPVDVQIGSTGTQIDLLDSDLIGDLPSLPTFQVTASGAGSTRELTGTDVRKAMLVTTCDTVIGT
jgi:hypothetical protein